MDTYTHGFSYKQGIINKATQDQLSKLGMGWVWVNTENIDHLIDCLTNKGFAVTPGHWAGGWKNNRKSVFWGASYVFLDFDGERVMSEVLADPLVKSSACFAYTTASHGIKDGDRFRLVFKMSREARSIEDFNQIIKGLKHLIPGSDPAINAVSCLFGNDRAEVTVFNRDNTLDVEHCIQTYEDSKPVRIVNHTTTAEFFGTDNTTLYNLSRWLKDVPADSYQKWFKVGVWLKSVVNADAISDEQGLQIYMTWSLTNYVESTSPRRCEPQFIEDSWEGFAGGGYGLLKIRALSTLTQTEDFEAIEALIQ